MNGRKWTIVAVIVSLALFIGVFWFGISAPSSLPNEYNYETMAEFA